MKRRITENRNKFGQREKQFAFKNENLLKIQILSPIQR